MSTVRTGLEPEPVSGHWCTGTRPAVLYTSLWCTALYTLQCTLPVLYTLWRFCSRSVHYTSHPTHLLLVKCTTGMCTVLNSVPPSTLKGGVKHGVLYLQVVYITGTCTVLRGHCGVHITVHNQWYICRECTTITEHLEVHLSELNTSSSPWCALPGGRALCTVHLKLPVVCIP